MTGGLQAQEARAGRLAFRSRSRTLTAEAVDRARTDERSLLRMWAMRTTIHMVPADDVDLFLAVYRDSIGDFARRRLASHFGVEPPAQRKALKLIAKALADDGPLTRKEIGERLSSANLFKNEQARYRLLLIATMERTACLGPDRGSDACFVRAEDWLGKPKKVDRAKALAELARRYIGAFGPATPSQFASWAGLPIGDCRGGLEAIAKELKELEVEGRTMLALRKGAPRLAPSPLVRLLPAFDTYLLGHGNRDFCVDPKAGKKILPGGGVLRPTVTVDGRLVAIWNGKRSGQKLKVSLTRLPGFDKSMIPAIEAEVADIGRFEGLTATLA